MTDLANVVSDLMLLENRLNETLADIDAMGIHLSCDRTPLGTFIENLIHLKGYYTAKEQEERR
jgi:hypothetical protein